jgi:hypothetical protein
MSMSYNILAWADTMKRGIELTMSREAVNLLPWVEAMNLTPLIGEHIVDMLNPTLIQSVNIGGEPVSRGYRQGSYLQKRRVATCDMNTARD